MNTLLVGSLLLSIFTPYSQPLAPGFGHQPAGRLVGQANTLDYVYHWIGACTEYGLGGGGVLAVVGGLLAQQLDAFSHFMAPALLTMLGGFYLYQHYRHRHFHLHRQNTRWGVVGTLTIAMFLSPCLEIEGYFLAAGARGLVFVGLLAFLYGTVTISGMIIWVWLAQRGLRRLDWHAWEHSAGLITGLTLLLSGIALLLFH